MDQYDLLSRLTVSLAIGLLVGLERGWHSREEEDGHRAAGFRTFALSGLLGGISGALAKSEGGYVIGLVFLGYAATFSAFHWLEARTSGNLSATSAIAGMLTFLLGAFCVVGDLPIAIAGAVAMTALLALREQLHRLIASLTWEEIRATLTLLAMTFLLLPILPNRTIDPWSVINPYEIWLLAVLIAAISFGGYIAVRVLGDRLGVIMAALAGGLASSTATSLTLAKKAEEHPAATRLLAAGILIAGAVMVARVGIVAVILNRALMNSLILPLAAIAVVLMLGSLLLLFGNKAKETPRLQITNPLEIATALKMAGLIVLIMLAAEILLRTFGGSGVLIGAAISGLADVDALTISMARMEGHSLDLDIAERAILIVVGVNTITKAALAAWAGGRRLGLFVAIPSILAVAAGLVMTTLDLSSNI
jgi:uncharacterized membrane protein (DUF4010 family)